MLAEAFDDDRRDEPGDGAAKHRDVDPRTLARGHAAVQRLHDFAIRMLGGAEVHHRHAEGRGRPLGLAGQRHEAAARLEHGIVRGLVVLGTEAADADPDQVAPHRAQRGLIDAQRGIGARPLVGRQHVDG